MIGFIHGKILYKNKGSLLINTTSGIGYEVRMPNLKVASYREGQDIELYTYLKVGESDWDLFGFETREEKAFFELLISVKSVGPKTALHILSLGSIENIQSAIARGDVTYLTAVQGLGKKTAERIVVELKSKIKGVQTESNEAESVMLGEVIDGLVAMGYSKEEAKERVQGMDGQGKTTEELLKIALQS